MVGKLQTKTARKMYSLSFYMFRMRLNYLGKIYGTQIIHKSEAYTSKTCTNCGKIKNDLGMAKIYNCQHCGMTIDRDINGARNILLKNMEYI